MVSPGLRRGSCQLAESAEPSDLYHDVISSVGVGHCAGVRTGRIGGSRCRRQYGHPCGAHESTDEGKCPNRGSEFSLA